MTVSRWLKVLIAGLVFGIALGTGVAVAVLMPTGSGDVEHSPPSAQALVEANEEGAWLGVMVSRFGDEGVIVQQVFADSPAHKAGIKRGDIIKAVEDKDVRTIRDLVTDIKDREPGDEVTLTLLRDDEEMALRVTLGAGPEPLPSPERGGPFAELGELEFADILGGQFTVKDDEGNTVVIEVVAGEVESIGDDELTVTGNDGGERTFTITDDTIMAQRPEEGDPVVVVTVGDSKEARLVLSGGLFQLLGMFGRLGYDIGERLMPPEIPRLDIPPLKERGSGLSPEWHFCLGPECGPERLLPPTLPGNGFWPWEEDSQEY
ncbi:MAG: hypothetical protein AMJ77_04350 [Dehalococcoidia bacterium SM23_28_2]|nr:MAG: hypothetical protein AMJ77_04350 [Dehalococcoidia bacterium SM23_28_2]